LFRDGATHRGQIGGGRRQDLFCHRISLASGLDRDPRQPGQPMAILLASVHGVDQFARLRQSQFRQQAVAQGGLGTAAVPAASRRLQGLPSDRVPAAFVADQIAPAAGACGPARRVPAKGQRTGAGNQRHADPGGRACGQNGQGIVRDQHALAEPAPLCPGLDALPIGVSPGAGQRQAGGANGRAACARRQQRAIDGPLHVVQRRGPSGRLRIRRSGFAAAHGLQLAAVRAGHPRHRLRAAAVDAQNQFRRLDLAVVVRGDVTAASARFGALQRPAQLTGGGGEHSLGLRRRDAATLDDDRRLDIAAATLQQRGRVVGPDAGQFPDDPPRTVRQFLVGRLQVDHQIAVGLAQLDHGAGGEHVQHQLGRRPGFQPSAAADHLRPDDRDDHLLRHGGHFGIGVARQADRQSSDLAGVAQAADHVGRAAAGGDAHHGVVAAEVNPLQILDSHFRTILRTFDRSGQRRRAAGDQADHLPRPRIERRRAFAGIQHAQPSGGAGAQVNQTSATAQAFGDPVERLGDGGGDTAHGPRDLRVLGVHQLDDLQRRKAVDLLRSRIPGFGGQLGQVHRLPPGGRDGRMCQPRANAIPRSCVFFS